MVTFGRRETILKIQCYSRSHYLDHQNLAADGIMSRESNDDVSDDDNRDVVGMLVKMTIGM